MRRSSLSPTKLGEQFGEATDSLTSKPTLASAADARISQQLLACCDVVVLVCFCSALVFGLFVLAVWFCSFAAGGCKTTVFSSPRIGQKHMT